MAPYVFAVDRIEAQNCKSKGQHNDSDWLHITVAIDEQTPRDTNFQINGNIHSGESFDGPFVAGPFEISDNSRVAVSFLVENKSHTDAAKQQSEVITVGTVLVTAFFGGCRRVLVTPPLRKITQLAFVAGFVVAAAGTVWATLVGNSDPDCNGEVLTRVLVFDRGDLAKLGTHTISDEARVGPSKEDCGNPPITKVTYSVREWTLRQMLITRNFDLSHPVSHAQSDSSAF